MKQTLSKIAILLFINSQFLILNSAFSQNISINGTGAIADPSAILDVSSPNTGLLIPRIALTAINVTAPVTSPTVSLLVYNTATASTGTNAVSPGYYYWDGVKWVRFAYSASGSSANDWNILGNAGTNPITNFLGTTDNQDLVFRRNNVQSGLLNSSLNNTSFGVGALNPASTGDRNVAIGTSALATNTTGAANVAIGHRALTNNDVGNNNVAVGTNAGYSNTTGNQNVWLGASSGFSNTTGGNNVAVGNASGRSNLTGTSNVFVGAGSGSENTTGGGNTFLGSVAGATNTVGGNNTYVGTFSGRYSTQSNNSAFGHSTLYNNTTGSDLVSIGYQSLYGNTTGVGIVGLGKGAGFSNTTGYYNTFIGTDADATAGTFTNATAIGYNAKVGQSNALILGGTGTNSVNVGIGTTTPIEKLHIVNGNARIDGSSNLLNNQSYIMFALNNGTNLGYIGDGGSATNNLNISSYNNDVVIGTGAISTTSNTAVFTQAGNFGIGTTAPTEKLEVQGSVKIVDGTQGVGKVLMSDAVGKGSWQSQIGSWYAHLSDGSSVNNTTGVAPIDFINSALVGTGGSVSTSADNIVVPVNGLYRIVISGWSSGITSPYLTYWQVKKNGGNIWSPHYASPLFGWGTDLSSTKVFILNAGDVLTLERDTYTESARQGTTQGVLFSVELIK